MKNLTFLKLFYATIFVMITALFAGCVDDNDDTEAPRLEISPKTLVFDTDGIPVEGSQSYFEISANRHWTATVLDDKTWVTLSKMEGDGSDKVQVSIPEGITDEAKVLIQISNKVGVLMKEEVTIRSGNVVPSVVIYNETFGTATQTDSKWPLVSDFSGWVKSGEGSSNVSYDNSGNVSLRQSGKLSSGYEGASGAAKVFFGTNSPSFIIKEITLKADQTSLKLGFGASYSKNVNNEYDNEFKPESFHVYLSKDGTTWSNAIQYDFKQADEYWGYVTSNFILKESTTTLYIKFAADIESGFAIDDVTLSTGNGGQEIDLGGGGSEPEPASAITIPAIIEMMSAEGTVIDANADRYFEAVVQNDIENGNYSNNNLILATKDATTSGNGVVLFGKLVDPKTLGVSKGDIIKVTLKKGLAKAQLYNKLYEVTGGQNDVWATIEKTGNKATITPIAVETSQLLDYQGMTVKIENANPKEAGVWGTDPGTFLFTAGGNEFTVFTKSGATGFVNQPFKPVNSGGTVIGVVTLYNGNPQIAPQSLDDVAPFKSTDPTIISANPKNVSFPAEGGTEEIEVAVANFDNKTLKVDGLSGILKAEANGTKVTVTASPNPNSALESQTLKLSVDGGNTIEVPITVTGKPSGNETIITLDLANKGNYPADFPTSKTIEEKSYTFDGYSYTFKSSGSDGYYYQSSGYLMLGKSGAYVELPSIPEKKLTKVTLTTRSGASKKVTVGIVDTSDNVVTGGESQLWDQVDDNMIYIYNLSETTVGTKYRIKVTNGNNAQLIKWELVYQ